MANSTATPKWPPSFGQALVYGAAVGLLVAIVFRPLESHVELQQIAVWRNFVLGGAFTGLVCRAVIGCLKRW